MIPRHYIHPGAASVLLRISRARRKVALARRECNRVNARLFMELYDTEGPSVNQRRVLFIAQTSYERARRNHALALEVLRRLNCAFEAAALAALIDTRWDYVS